MRLPLPAIPPSLMQFLSPTCQTCRNNDSPHHYTKKGIGVLRDFSVERILFYCRQRSFLHHNYFNPFNHNSSQSQSVIGSISFFAVFNWDCTFAGFLCSKAAGGRQICGACHCALPLKHSTCIVTVGLDVKSRGVAILHQCCVLLLHHHYL
jgi:hypothetical protein